MYAKAIYAYIRTFFARYSRRDAYHGSTSSLSPSPSVRARTLGMSAAVAGKKDGSCEPGIVSGPAIYRRTKRFVDIVVAAAALAVCSVPMAFIALAIRLSMGKPILFSQLRPGLDEKLFRCLKFRTMTFATDENGEFLSDELRTTRLGSFLRRTSLDELPQFWNVLCGDLSLVGPRPLLRSYLPHYTEEERQRHSVRPGLTGWAQIQGRNHALFGDRLHMDIWYVNHMNWKLDLAIVARTVWVVLTQRGVAFDSVRLDELRSGRQGSINREEAPNHGRVSEPRGNLER